MPTLVRSCSPEFAAQVEILEEMPGVLAVSILGDEHELDGSFKRDYVYRIRV